MRFTKPKVKGLKAATLAKLTANAKRSFKYEEHLCKHEDCPPESYAAISITAYRFVYEDDPEKKSYLPQALKPKPRTFHTSKQQCQALGLSVYTSETSARAKFESLKPLFAVNVAREKVMKILGTHIRSLAVTANHGVCSEPDVDGHFTFHEYDDCDCAAISTLIGEAPP